MFGSLPRSITAETSGLIAISAALVFLVMGINIRSSVDRYFIELDAEDIESKFSLIQDVAESVSSSEDINSIGSRLASLLIGHNDILVRIQDEHGADIFVSGQDVFPLHLLASSTPPHALRSIEINHESYRFMHVKIPANHGISSWNIGMAISTKHHQDFLNVFNRQVVLIGAGGLFLMSILGWAAVKRGLVPLQEMTGIAERITADSLGERLREDSVPVELKNLAKAFNAMLDRLSGSLDRLSEFSSELAHELRTPVNNLLTQNQVLLAKPRTEEEYLEIIYSNLEEFERLARMISGMLFLAKADNGLVIPNRTEVLLHREVDAVIEFYEALAAEQGLKLSSSGNAVVLGDGLMLRQVISNLLSNAVRYARSGSEIGIKITEDGDLVRLSICNVGESINEKHLPFIFDRFYRVDASRHRTDEGAGLGLSISKSIVLAHNGSIGVKSKNGMTEFLVELPGIVRV